MLAENVVDVVVAIVLLLLLLFLLCCCKFVFVVVKLQPSYSCIHRSRLGKLSHTTRAEMDACPDPTTFALVCGRSLDLTCIHYTVLDQRFDYAICCSRLQGLQRRVHSKNVQQSLPPSGNSMTGGTSPLPWSMIPKETR